MFQTGIEFREVDIDGEFPVFRFTSVRQNSGRPKNLIFASHVKPDLRFRDAVNNDIEIVSGIENALIYDRPFPIEGLYWSDLQDWWEELNGTDDDEKAKRSLTNVFSLRSGQFASQKVFLRPFFSEFSS